MTRRQADATILRLGDRLQAGDHIARYVVLGKLATGGMAEVWLVRQRGPAGFAKTLVLKTIHGTYAESEDFLQMFLEEARLAALINHPNVVQIFDLGDDEGRYFIAMEYLEGRNLSHVAKALDEKKQPFPINVAARIVAEACAGLDFAHSLRDASGAPLNLIHRDVSPENILITYAGQVKLLDFGIAKAAESSHFTRPGTVKGKLSYLAPEQVRGQTLDRRLDIWALGVNLYVLTTGKKPFSGKNEIEGLRAILEQDPLRPSTARADMPPRLEKIILKAMQKDADSRYPTAGAMRADLEEYLKDQPTVGPYQIAQLMDAVFPPQTDAVRKQLVSLASAPTPLTTSSVSPIIKDEDDPSSSTRRQALADRRPSDLAAAQSTGEIVADVDLSAEEEGEAGEEEAYAPTQMAESVVPYTGPRDEGDYRPPDLDDDMPNTAVTRGPPGFGQGSTRPIVERDLATTPGVPRSVLTSQAREEEAQEEEAQDEPETDPRDQRPTAHGLDADELFGDISEVSDLNSPPTGVRRRPAKPSFEDSTQSTTGAGPRRSVFGAILRGVGLLAGLALGLVLARIIVDHVRKPVEPQPAPVAEAKPAAPAEPPRADPPAPRPAAPAPGPVDAPRPPVVPPGAIAVTANVRGELFLDDRSVGHVPTIITNVPAGDHRLRLVSDQGTRKELPVIVLAGGTVEKRFVVPAGRVRIRVAPWATVTIDGKNMGTTPMPPISLLEGPHEIVLENSELKAKKRKTITIHPGREVELKVRMNE